MGFTFQLSERLLLLARPEGKPSGSGHNLAVEDGFVPNNAARSNQIRSGSAFFVQNLGIHYSLRGSPV